MAIFGNDTTDRISGTGNVIAQLSNTLGSKINFPFTATMGGLGTGNPQ
jgi:hypothetical protein